MLNALQPWHIIVLVVVLLALFGAKRLPDAARGIGTSMRIFKAEAKSLQDENEEHTSTAGEPATHATTATRTQR
ncbi:MAG: Sec-independent protein translocase subunit TatA [Sciscionella sp.]